MTWSTPGYIYTPTATVDASDHFTITAEIQFKHNQLDSKWHILYQYTHDVDIIAFNDDIVKSELITNPKAELCEQYHVTPKTLQTRTYQFKIP